MTATLIAILVLAVLFVIGYAMRVLHIVEIPKKKKKKPDPDAPFPDFPGFEDEYAEPPDLYGASDDEEGEGELVDLLDYFADEGELEEDEDEFESDPDAVPATAAAGHPAAPETEDNVEVQYDRLCNLPTGRGFLVRCQNRLSLAVPTGQAYAVACFDYDRFRFINTLKGFSIGDYALQKTSQEIRDIFPEGAMISRVSADHFLAVFAYTDEQQLADYADRLRRMAERIRSDIGAKSGLRVCIGVAITDGREDSYDIMALQLQANIARHCLKITKRDAAYSLFDPSMIDTFLLGESALEDYSENQYNDEFELYFQPVYSLGAGRISASEAIARWVYEDNNTEQPPSTENGLLPTNNLKIIYHAFKAMSRWRREGNEVVPVMVNLPVLDLYKEDIDAFFARSLSEFQIEPRMVTVVVDIHTVGLNWEMAEKQLGKLRDFGMEIAVSGIDRGFQTFDFLAQLPIRYLKMHPGVAHEVATREDRQAAVRAVLANARENRLDAIFEGVDYSTAAACLKDLGAAMVEGAYAGLAGRAEDFARSLQEHLKQRRSAEGGTLVLDDETLARGNYKVF